MIWWTDHECRRLLAEPVFLLPGVAVPSRYFSQVRNQTQPDGFLPNMRSKSLAVLAVLTIFATATALAQQAVTLPRSDGAQTPLRMFAPNTGCAPLAIISPGAGGTENGYTYLAEGLRDMVTSPS